MGNRARRALYWGTPPLLILSLYWPGMCAWFQRDDFAWLGLRQLLRNGHGFWWVMFSPMAQGTIRPVSERAYFMGLTALFGLHPLPFRVAAFTVGWGDWALLAAVATRLTKSRAAGWWAGALWCANSVLATAFAWACGFNQLLCAFFVLAAFWCLLRYEETGARRFAVGQWAAFLLGLGTLETMVVYPALAAVYALCRNRRLLRGTLPFFAASAAFIAVHFAVAPAPEAGPYRMYWDGRMVDTLWKYWKWAMGPNRWMMFGVPPSFGRSLLTALPTAALVLFCLAKLRRRQWTAALYPAWFVVFLLPVLPLREHAIDQYLTMPLLGLAIWGAWALVSGWRGRAWSRVAAVCVAGAYLAVSMPLTWKMAEDFNRRSQKIRAVLTEVVAVKRARPETTVVLWGVDHEVFWDALYHRPFRLYNVTGVHIAAEDEARLAPDPHNPEQRGYFLARPAAVDAIESGKALVYDIRSGHIREATARYLVEPQRR